MHGGSGRLPIGRAASLGEGCSVRSHRKAHFIDAERQGRGPGELPMTALVLTPCPPLNFQVDMH